MARTLKSIFFPPSSKWKYWLFIAFISRFIFFLLVIHFSQYQGFKGFWGGMRADSEGYMLPFDNLVKTGAYSPDYRMPGYGVLYLPLILIFSKAVTCNIIIIIQLFFSVTSVYALALIARNLFKNEIPFCITFYLFAVSSFSSLMDPVILAESLSTSVLILSVYFITVFFNNYKRSNLILSGLLLTWGVFLRPVFCLLIICFFALILLNLIKTKRKFIVAFLFLLPFTLIDGSWIIRNYIVYKDPAPLTRTVLFPWIENSHLLPIMNFVEAWGGDVWFINPNAEATWFINNKPCTNDTVPFPKYIYTSAFNTDSLKMLKTLITKMGTDTSLSAMQKKEDERIVISKLNTYTASIKKEKPYIYYVKSNEIRLFKFLFSIHSVSKLFINNFITRFYSMFYYITICLGLVGLIFLLPYVFKASLQSIVAIVPIYIILIHPIVLRLNENRYLIPAYPFMLVAIAYLIYTIYCRVQGVSEKSVDKIQKL